MIIVISKNIATLRLETISLEWLTGAFVGCLKFLKELVSFNLSEYCQSTNNNNIIIKICIAPIQVLLLALHKRLTLPRMICIFKKIGLKFRFKSIQIVT